MAKNYLKNYERIFHLIKIIMSNFSHLSAQQILLTKESENISLQVITRNSKVFKLQN
jgi:hypothetical protein